MVSRCTVVVAVSGRGTMSVSLALLVILAAVASGLDDVRPRVGKQFRDEERKKYDIELTFPVDGDDATNRRTEGLNREIQKLLEQIVLEGDSLVSYINIVICHIVYPRYTSNNFGIVVSVVYQTDASPMGRTPVHQPRP